MNFQELAAAVRDISLCDVLHAHGFEIKTEGASFRAKNDHFNIVVTASQWFDNKAGIGGGGAIDLYRHIAKVDFSTACRELGNLRSMPIREGISFPRTAEKKDRRSFEELAAEYAVRDDTQWHIARSYLVDKRGIPASLVDAAHGKGSLFANNHRPNPSIVFLHHDKDGQVHGATLRDTIHQSAFCPCLGNKTSAWFAVGDLSNAQTIAAVESPIDALSYYHLNRNSGLAVVSCAGAVVPIELMHQAYENRQSFIVALDNDSAGSLGWGRAWDQTVDWGGFKISSDLPRNKDWNNDLIESLGIKHSFSLRL